MGYFVYLAGCSTSFVVFSRKYEFLDLKSLQDVIAEMKNKLKSFKF